MAVGHAKYTGGVGVVLSTQGPGAVHLLDGLYDAKLDAVPVVAIVGQPETSALGTGYQQGLDLQTPFGNATGTCRPCCPPSTRHWSSTRPSAPR